VLVNIKGIHGLKGVRKKGQVLRVGALTTLNELTESPLLDNGLSFLKGVIRKIGGVETRNLGTVGGNLFTHAPAAGLAPILLCLRAKGVVSDGAKKQEIPLEDLFDGFGKLNQLPRLPNGQILVEIVIPELKAGVGAGYEKTTVMVSPMSPPVASAATMVRLDPRGKMIQACRIYIGSCAPSYPHRSEKAEDYLLKKPFDEGIGKEAAEMATADLKPIPDGYSSAAYRSQVAGILVNRVLKQAVQAALANPSR
jgi:carbon-monoxide dehydrogenase medium subunit